MAKLPVAVLFRDHWASVLRVVLCALVSVVSTIVGTWSLAQGTSDEVGLERTTLLWMVILGQRGRAGRAAAVGEAVGPDRPPPGVRVRRARLGGAGFPFLWALQQGERRADLRVRRSCSPASPTRRPTASGPPSTARCSTPGCATPAWRSAPRSGSPSAASHRPSPPHRRRGPGGWLPVALLTAGAATVAGLCALTARETAHVPTAQLGLKPGRGAHPPARERLTHPLRAPAGRPGPAARPHPGGPPVSLVVRTAAGPVAGRRVDGVRSWRGHPVRDRRALRAGRPAPVLDRRPRRDRARPGRRAADAGRRRWSAPRTA